MKKKQTYGLKVRIQLVRESRDVKSIKVKSSEDVYNLAKHLEECDREQLLTICLSAQNEVLSIETTSIGTLTSSLICPREVLKTAILQNAASIIVVHNHPSGNITPSREDIEITKKLYKCSEMMGFSLLDHVIIGNGKFNSLKENGMLGGAW